MAKTTISQWDIVAANNLDLNSISLAEGVTLPSAVNDLLREDMAEVARLYHDLGANNTVSGSANAWVITTAQTFTALATGLLTAFKPTASNTTAATANVDGLGAKAIRRKGDSALLAGDMLANGIYWLEYDAAYNAAAGAWVLLNPETSVTLAAGMATFLATPTSANLATAVTDEKGSGSLTFGGVTIPRLQVFTASGTYTPNANLLYAVIQCCGSGGGGGGVASSTQTGGGGGGGGGGTSTIIASAATIGVSQVVTVGAAGTGGAVGNNAGVAGGDVSVGAICIGKGGSAGGGAAANTAGTAGAGGVAGTGTLTIPGGSGGVGGNSNSNIVLTGGGAGGSSLFGSVTLAGAQNATGVAGALYGSGGAGGISLSTGGAQAGGLGGKGVVFITEYCSA